MKNSLRKLDSRTTYVAPSILAADFSRLGKEICDAEHGGADIIHIDVMDAHFVPNLSMGPAVVRSIRPVTERPFDVHLMMTHPGPYVVPFSEAGADNITIHTRIESDIRPILREIHDCGCSAGICLKPNTSASEVTPYMEELDLILVMTVEPGFGGQSFMSDMLPKIRELRQSADALSPSVHIEVDGGINPDTAPLAVHAGANILVAGSSVFGAADKKKTIDSLKTAK